MFAAGLWLLAASITGGAVGSCGPLTVTPNGWLCIPHHGIDAWTGSYFDTQSGVLVHFAYGKATAPPPDASVVETKTAQGRSFTVWRRADARRHAVERLRRDLGAQDIDGLFPAELLPPADRPEFHVDVAWPDGGVAFEAFPCGSEQEERIRELVLGASFATRQAGTTQTDLYASVPLQDVITHGNSGTLAALLAAVPIAPEHVRDAACGTVAVVYRARACDGSPIRVEVMTEKEGRVTGLWIR